MSSNSSKSKLQHYYNPQNPKQLIYSWEQSFDTIDIYISLPSHITTAKQLNIQIQSSHIIVGLKSTSQPYISHDLYDTVDVSESLWTVDLNKNNTYRKKNNNNVDSNDEQSAGQLHIALTKADVGSTWLSVFKGHDVNVNDADKENLKSSMLLERFQREHPGFDFSNAVVSGQVPEAKTFMNGYDREKIRRNG
jgi:hypothetical protein